MASMCPHPDSNEYVTVRHTAAGMELTKGIRGGKLAVAGEEEEADDPAGWVIDGEKTPRWAAAGIDPPWP